MKKVKSLIFYTPPMQNHYFWVPMEAKIELQSKLGANFIAIKNDNGKMMLIREGSERTRGRLGGGFGLGGEGDTVGGARENREWQA